MGQDFLNRRYENAHMHPSLFPKPNFMLNIAGNQFFFLRCNQTCKYLAREKTACAADTERVDFLYPDPDFNLIRNPADSVLQDQIIMEILIQLYLTGKLCY